MLSLDYTAAFTSNLHNFCISYLNKMWSRKEEASHDQFTLFYPLIGKDYLKEKQILVVGQATNGWEPKFTVDDLLKKGDSEIVNQAISYSKEDGSKCPLEWINEGWSTYGLYRSFFWNITYKTVKKFYGRTDEDWNNIIAWSNLMKIAPAEGGNPDELVIDCQLGKSAYLFKKEIEELQPKNVLLMTNLKTWAEPILKHLDIQYDKIESPFIEAVAYINNSKLIITKRGYFKVTHEEAIQEISNHLVP